MAVSGSSLSLLATSPSFIIDTPTNVFDPLVSNSLFFFRAQRDGPNVDPTVMNRQPSHLADESATIYETPTYKDDTLQGSLSPVSGAATIDASGGWFDAGDYLKFIQTSSYVELMMLLAIRDYSSTMTTTTVTQMQQEALHGLDWLLKMWNPTSKTMYYQVGIGDGNNEIAGDHDFWRLPQADDAMNVKPGNSEYYVKYRPVFQTTTSISPNLAGRMTAAFALCNQVFRSINATLASICLNYAEQIYAGAATNPAPSTLMSAAPFDYYPETQWRDDMELGAVELFKATGTASYLTEAANYASLYIKSDDKMVLNLYDVAGLAHYELFKAISDAPSLASSLAVTPASVLSDMAELLNAAITQGAKDPFHFGDQYDSGNDLVPEAFGYWLQSSFYGELSGDSTFQLLETQNRDWIFGSNAWGASFVIGAGSSFPMCPQHQVANLAGSLDGVSTATLSVLKGGTVDGPSVTANFKGLGSIDDSNACNNDNAYSAYTAQGVTYEDNVASWPSVEPADDYTVIGLYAFARMTHILS